MLFGDFIVLFRSWTKRSTGMSDGVSFLTPNLWGLRGGGGDEHEEIKYHAYLVFSHLPLNGLKKLSLPPTSSNPPCITSTILSTHLKKRPTIFNLDIRVTTLREQTNKMNECVC